MRLDNFFEHLYNQLPVNELETCSAAEFDVVKNKKRQELKQALGLDKLLAYNHSIITETLKTEEREGLSITSMAMEILPQLKMPVFVIKPTGIARPGRKAVLYCHGHGEGGIKDCFVEKNPIAYHKNIPLALARRGYEVFAFEPAGFGDFIIEDFNNPELGGCFPLTTRLSLYGITTLGLRIYQALCLGSFMRSDGVKDYATLGISGGGTCCSFLSAIDDSHKLNVISCYANTFKGCIMQIHHCIDNFVPNVLSIGEMPHIISLAAPKKMFITAGTRDPIFPIEETMKAVETIEKIYDKLGIRDGVAHEYFDGEHEFSLKFIDWLDNEL